ANQQQQADDSQDSHAHLNRHGPRGIEYFRKVQRSELSHDEKHGERKSEVADSVYDERFVAGIGGKLLEKIEPDQQVTAEPHTFPSNEQQQEVLREHQNQHEEHEEVQVGEEAVISALVRHVADRIDVDQQSDSGYHHEHHGGQPVDGKINADVQIAALDPGEVVLDIFCFEGHQPQERLHNPRERKSNRSNGEDVHHRFRQSPA